MKRKYFVLNTVTVLTLATAMNTSSIYANSTETSASVAPTTNTIVQTNDSNPTAKFASESGQSVIGQVKPANSAALTTVDTPHISAPDALKTTQSSPVVESPSTKLTEETYKQKDGQDLANMVRSGQVTSEELVNMAYDIIAKENPSLNAVITTRRQEAIEEARKLKDTNQPFLGVPLLVKGLGHSIKGGETNNGLIYADGKISTFDSSYVKKYKDLGFIILGQTNFPEYGWRNITDSKLYGPTHNPWNLAHNAGGSSGGSAAAIASGMTPIASGSDAGGSIRIPSSWTGLVGLKPTRGLVSNEKPDSYSTAVHFPLTKSSRDAETLLTYLKKSDQTLVSVNDLKSLPIAYTLKSPMGTEVSQDAKNAIMDNVTFLRKQGFKVTEIDLPIDGRALMRDYSTLAIGMGGAFSTIEKDLKKHGFTKEDVDPITWAVHVIYQNSDKAELKKSIVEAQKHMDDYRKAMEKLHKQFPIFLSPTTASLAPLNTDPYVTEKDKRAIYNMENLSQEERIALFNRQWEPMLRRTPFTPIANMTGLPAISIPTYLSESGLPIGMMLMAGANYDMVLIKFATFFEKHHGFNVKWQRIIDKEVKPSADLIQPTNSLFKAHSSLVNLEENSQVTQVSISKKWMKSSVKNKPSVMAYQKALPKTGDTESSLSPVLVVTLLLACFSFVTKKNQKS
ncbi:TPA: amidase family protein [Streptococcus agalactiae]|uniref:amidase family protein n=1 Tax=Streptococcus agalactiae TaxID=1311 RepID=UPI0002BA5162|nr:amidase family protein [Streptococcus agalactiae]EPU76869.1 amidase [Streptococcus agalactiae GB00115]HEN2246724.1 LPXTG cell wall anchor domain-containing protein [Streptococcus agalactiae]HEN3161758.1 LPXTG cell wall anchor domain-containing protein [Streptococcus agalactiae]HEN3167990.1 LPXTG cell wall anchor domain-containing protein [Streptococcus agalactiae]HEN3214559.1 LPXTG cell wall anchor domain-containing protein [Streptococcus agalactiae]